MKNLADVWFSIARKLGRAAGFSTAIYSQEGEDVVVKRLFDGRQSGFYVEVGCHHPFRFSNTFLLYKMGWSGICIDPLPGTVALFKKARNRDVVVECGVARKVSELSYYMFNEAALNTFDEKIAKSRDGLRGYRMVETRIIEVMPLADIIGNNIKASQHEIDLLSIDVEGFDLEVLQSNDWTKYRPKVVIAECLEIELNAIGSDPVAVYLSGLGYVIYAKTGNSVIFVDKNFNA